MKPWIQILILPLSNYETLNQLCKSPWRVAGWWKKACVPKALYIECLLLSAYRGQMKWIYTQMVKSRYHYHFKRRLLCRRHFVLRLSERSLTIQFLKEHLEPNFGSHLASHYLCGTAPIWVSSKMNWGQFYILTSEDGKRKQWAEKVHAFQNHFILACSDECTHKQSHKIHEDSSYRSSVPDSLRIL